jgi:hypothetical protein
VALCFALFRLTLGRVASGFFAFAFLSSPYVLTHLPGLRDYSRGVFSLLSVWFLFFLVLKTEISERRKCISVTVLAAIALGFASRIRPDLVVCLPIVLMGIAFLGKTAVEKVYLKFKLSLLGLFFLLFALISYGIPYKWRDYTPHIWANQLTVNILHGQMGNQTADLGIAEPPYELGHWAIDQEISLLMMSYNERVRNEPEILEQYDVTAGKRLFASVLEDYPADFLFRFVASIRSMVNLPITVPDWWQTPTGGDSLLLRGTDMRLNLNRRLLQEFPAISQFSILLFAVALVAIVLWTPLPGVVIAFSVLYFFAIPALRFQPRHYFFYEVLGWWVWATALKGLLIGGLALARKRPSIEELKRFRPSKKAAAVVGTGLAVGLLYLGTLTVLRKIQDSRLKGRISEILSSERVQVTPVLRAQSSGQNAGQTLVLLSGNAAAEPLGLGKIRTHYFGVKFSREMCSQSVVDFDVVYDKPSSVAPGFGRHVRINLKRAGSDVLYLFPTYDLTYQDGVLFQGIRLDSADAACFKEAFRLARTPKDPFLMNIKLTDDWRATDFYQSYLVQ